MTPTTRASNLSTLKLPVAWLSMAVFFVYTGIEAAAGIWSYSLFTEVRGVPMMSAGIWVSVYWGSLSVGRLLSGLVVGLAPPARLLRWCIVGAGSGCSVDLVDLRPSTEFCRVGSDGTGLSPDIPFADCRNTGTARARSYGEQHRLSDRCGGSRPIFASGNRRRVGRQVWIGNCGSRAARRIAATACFVPGIDSRR